ncbi:MAG: 4-(cytidine 5'-diphospho)-2-C-methyl-D-erythritol kinase [Gemmatimonadota bacterium]
MTEDWLETEARAKVNLRLRIFPRRADGFHPLQTIFCRIDLADRVRVRLRPEPGVSIRVSGGEPVPEAPDNLAARAAAVFLERSAAACGAAIELHKRIPAGSGLGGGSSDAAAVLRLLAGLMGPLEPDELGRLASGLGADVAFFAADAPLALAVERGDQLVSRRSLEARPMLLLVPDVRVSTAEAYAWWDEDHAGTADTPTAVPPALLESARWSWSGLRSQARNDFEPVIFARVPLLRSLRDKLERTQPELALLSGSGSALFAVYETESRRDEAALRLDAELEAVRVVTARGPV